MSAIYITDPVKLREAIEFAQNAGCLDQFALGFVRLMQTLSAGMTDDNEQVAQVSGDFAPHSFSFAIWRDVQVRYDAVQLPQRDKLLLNGGFIYAGPGAPGDGSGPSFSVDLSWVTGQRPLHSWNVHT
jgi:hypothetical protein